MPDPAAPAVLPFRTDRLLVRPFTLADAPVLAAYRDDPEIARFQDWALPFTDEMARGFVESQRQVTGPVAGSWVQLAVEAHGELIGDVAVGLDEAGRAATIGYTFRTEWQGRGFALEAVGAVVDRLFETTAVRRVAATLDPANTASARLLEALGFRYEGRAVAVADVRGEWADDDRYALLRTDREAWRSRPRAVPGRVRLVEIGPDEVPALRSVHLHHSQEVAFGTPLDALVDALVPPVRHGVELSPWVRGIEADGVLVGLLVLSEASLAHGDAALQHLSVDRWHQRRGIGQLALGHAARRLRLDGERVLRARWVDARGGPGPFLRRVGFAVEASAGTSGAVEGALTL